MSTVTRAELSKKNKWWIPKHRYYELKHFCMQYPEWKKERASLSTFSGGNHVLENNGSCGRPTESTVERLMLLDQRIDIVERAAVLSDPCIGSYILDGIVNDISYDVLCVRKRVPCCRDVYYELYRKFFYILSELRM